jgi:hypothetical protein
VEAVDAAPDPAAAGVARRTPTEGGRERAYRGDLRAAVGGRLPEEAGSGGGGSLYAAS